MLKMKWLKGAVAVPILALVLGCSVNPATGKKQLNLVSESQEIAMGQQADQQIVAQMGLYGGDEMQAYIQDLGSKLAALSERPHLPWTFRVLDDPIVNAFALPGGYIYMTRGIMAHLNTEAELISVLGHEIGHVTARHGVNQMSKQQLLGLGLGIGMVVSPELASVGDLAAQGLGLLFLKYSRDDERQADELGLRYSVRGGYDPRGGPTVFEVLKRVSDASGGGRIPSYLSTHPDPDARRQRLTDMIVALDQDFDGAAVNRRPYLERIDGMVFGPNPREGYFEESLFLHPDMRFKLDFPDGWKTANQRSIVLGVSPQQDAVVQLTLAQEEDPAAAARALASGEGIESGPVKRTKINGYPAATVEVARNTEQARLHGLAGFVRYNDMTFRLLGYTTEENWSRYARTTSEFIGSFGRLRDRKALNVQPARISIIDLKKDLPLTAFDSQYPSSIPIEELALINHVETSGTLQRGLGAKRVTGGRAE